MPAWGTILNEASVRHCDYIKSIMGKNFKMVLLKSKYSYSFPVVQWQTLSHSHVHARQRLNDNFSRTMQRRQCHKYSPGSGKEDPRKYKSQSMVSFHNHSKLWPSYPTHSILWNVAYFTLVGRFLDMTNIGVKELVVAAEALVISRISWEPFTSKLQMLTPSAIKFSSRATVKKTISPSSI